MYPLQKKKKNRKQININNNVMRENQKKKE